MGMRIFPLGACGGTAPHRVHLGPLMSGELLELESWGAGELSLYFCIQVKVFVHCLLCVILLWIFFILACRRHVYCQGHRSRSNVIVSYLKDSHYATALCGNVMQCVHL